MKIMNWRSWGRVAPLFTGMGSHGKGGASRLTIVGLVAGLIALGALVACPTEEDEDDETVLPAPTISSVSAADTGEGSGSTVTITLNIALPSSVRGASVGYDLAGEGTASPADVDDFSGASLMGLTETATIGSNRAELTFTTVATLNDGDGDEQARVTVTGIAFTPAGQATTIEGATENNSDAFTITTVPLPMPTISSVSAADINEGSGSPVTITLNIALPSSVSSASVGYELAGEGTASPADVDDFSGASLMGLTETATIGSNRAELTFTTVATLNDGDGDEQARVTVTGIAFTPAGQAENISGATENNSDAFTIGEIPPVFSGAPYSFSIGEGSYSAGSPGAVGTVSAMPATRYAITAGDAGTRFAIDAASGVLTAVDELDFETTPSYTLTVTAHNGADNDDPSATAMVEITVTDIQTGMADEPYTIDSVTELQSIDTGFSNEVITTALSRADSLAAHYLLTADLDLTGHDPDGDGSGFNPIGDCGIVCDDGDDNRFTGVFDGGGHTIRNLTINRTATNGGGLFAITASTAVVRTVRLMAATIVATNSSSALVGHNAGMIDGSTVDATITDGFAGRGGIGLLSGTNAGFVQNSSASGDIMLNTSSSQTGALVGLNSQTGTVRNSWATATVRSVNSSFTIGGLIGENYGLVQDVYATGSITTTSSATPSPVGGLIGANGGISSGARTIARAYAIGSVSNDGASFSPAGLLGINIINSVIGTIADSYWNRESLHTNGDTEITNNDKVGVGDQIGTQTRVYGLTTAQLQAPTAPDASLTLPSGHPDGDGAMITVYNGWSANDWHFGASSQYPALRRFTFVDANDNGLFDEGETRLQGELICGQPAPRAQCSVGPN